MFGMPIINPRKIFAHLFGPDRHHQKAQRRIIELIITLVGLAFDPIIQREITPKKRRPRFG